MTDTELTRALERGELPPGAFHHAEHLRTALVYLNEAATVPEAIERMPPVGRLSLPSRLPERECRTHGLGTGGIRAQTRGQ